jgi:hypothetical protein
MSCTACDARVPKRLRSEALIRKPTLAVSKPVPANLCAIDLLFRDRRFRCCAAVGRARQRDRRALPISTSRVGVRACPARDGPCPLAYSRASGRRSCSAARWARRPVVSSRRDPTARARQAGTASSAFNGAQSPRPKGAGSTSRTVSRARYAAALRAAASSAFNGAVATPHKSRAAPAP